MTKTKYELSNLGHIVSRYPIYALSEFKIIPSHKKKLKSFSQELFNNSSFKEAVYIASPSLFNEWEKLIKENSLHTNEKLMKSLVKYFIRCVSNCVPFGLFSYYSIIENDTENKLNFEKRFFQYDMNFLTHIIEEIKSDSTLSGYLRYYVNSTIFEKDSRLKYIEPKIKGRKRFYKEIGVQHDEVLRLIINLCECGLTKKELADTLRESIDGVSDKEIMIYINKIIESGILITDLDVAIDDSNPLETLLKYFTEFKSELNSHYLIVALKNLINYKSLIGSLDAKKPSENIDKYKRILEDIDSLNFGSSSNYVFNFNLKKNPPNYFNFSNDDALVKKAIDVISRFTTDHPEKKFSAPNNLEQFKDAFFKTYGESELPLLEVMDTTYGIGYIQSDNDFNSFSDLIDDLTFPKSKNNFRQIYSDSEKDSFWYNIIYKSIRNKENKIDLSKENTEQFPSKLNQLKGTFSVLYNKINEKISIVSSGGTTALQFIGRFTKDDKDIYEIGKDIIKTERTLFEDKIMAEILHLPNNRAGNISGRKTYRDAEISIFSKSSKKLKEINLQDILISLKRDELILKDKITGKEIIPFLSSAQNFHRDTLPLYHFLCDLQFQYRPNTLSLDISKSIVDYFPFIPRITYGENIILEPARWTFDEPDIHLFTENFKIQFKKFNKFCEVNDMPYYLLYLENGNEPLLIDRRNEFLVENLIKINKSIKKLRFQEFLFRESDFENHSMNENLVFFKSNYRYLDSNNFQIKGAECHLQRKFLPGSEWIYFKIYMNVNYADYFIKNEIGGLLALLENEDLIKNWFFIRYKDPDFHIRLRFNLLDETKSQKVLNIVNCQLKNKVNNGIIRAVKIDTYDREIERYNYQDIEISEKIFGIDSYYSYQILSENLKYPKWIYTIYIIDKYLSLFDFSLFEKQKFSDQIFRNIMIEVGGDKNLRLQIDKKYRKFRNDFDEILKARDYDYVIHQIDNSFIKIGDIYNKHFNNANHEIKISLLASFIHMHVNRVTISNQGMHELVYYGLIRKFYKSELGIQKYVNENNTSI